ncbi:hypothetical protein [Actibacterium lipolyticum]|uniref:Outer membrane beta-barrel protein n=1 Tax=Actibacterium lipolyticum TaxID=1524263 RepID=A0A238KUA3_9RHOB|nr:hypothetical protein [Actibacterium lipolyticum]SMX46444.1 hypothetical protein COL8621_03119 [Actibacterium lipolyticum]
MSWRHRFLIGAGGLALSATPILWASAQTSETGFEAFLDLSQTLRVSDNSENVSYPSGTSTFAQTDLTFGISSQTRAEKFDLRIGGAAQFGYFADDGGTGTDFENPFASLSYEREASNSRLSFSANVIQKDASSVILDSDFDSSDLTVDSGKRNYISAKAGFETGIDGPLGFSVDAGLRKRTYSDTTDPSLTDNKRETIDAAMRFQVSPVLELKALTGYDLYTAEDAADTERKRVYFGAGFAYDATPSLSFSGRLTQDMIDRSETVNGTRTTNSVDEASLRLGAQQELANGNLSADLTSRAESTGRRNTFTLGREMELRSGALGFHLGVTDSEDTDARAIAGLSYEQELPAGRFIADLTQTALTDTNDSEILRTQLSMNYQHEINASSSLGARFTYADVNSLTAGTADTERASLSVSYNYALTQDWNMQTGFEHSYANESGSDATRANTVFLGLERRFSLRN